MLRIIEVYNIMVCIRVSRVCCAETGPHSTRRRLCVRRMRLSRTPRKKKMKKRKRTDRQANKSDGRRRVRVRR